MGFNLGSFASGLTSGIDTGQQVRQNRQLEKYRSQQLELGNYALDAARQYRQAGDEFGGTDLQPMPEDLPPTYAERLFNWFHKQRKKTPSAGLVTSAAAPGLPSAASPIPYASAPTDLSSDSTDATFGYADGGTLPAGPANYDPYLGNPELQAAAPATAPTLDAPTAQRALGGVKNAGAAASDAMSQLRQWAAAGAPQDAGLIRRMVNSNPAGYAVLGSAIAGAARGMGTDTEQYRKRFGLETDDPSLAGDLGVRAFGVAGDFGNELANLAAIIPGVKRDWLAKLLFRDYQDQGQGQDQGQAPAAAAAPQQAIPTLPEVTVTGRRAAPQQARRQALPTQPQATNTNDIGEPGAVNFAEIEADHNDVPTMKQADWVAYRRRLLKAAVASGNPAEVEKMDQMVTGMQQRGFLTYLQQGQQLQLAGDNRGAMAAFRAAYQFFPNGRDVAFGTHQGQIVAYGKDEKTGEPLKDSKAMVLTPKTVAMMVENFSDPKAFRAWTTDHRDFDQEMRKYNEVTRPLAQAQAQAATTNARANMMEAEARMSTAAAAAAKGGEQPYRQADMRGDSSIFSKAVEDLQIDKPQDAQQLAALMGLVKQRYPDKPPAAVAMAVRKAYDTQQIPQLLQALGIRLQ